MLDVLNHTASRIVGADQNRREFLGAGLVSLAIMAACAPKRPTGFEIKTIYARDLPPLNLNLEGDFRFHLEGKPEAVLSAGDAFSETPGDIHLPSGSASATKRARVLVLSFGEK